MTKQSENIRIFVSYSWSNTDVADQIERDLSQLQINLVRDVRDIKYKSSIPGFMESIREADYALVLISKEYLESKNCMNEVLNLLKERNYEEKILPIVIGNPGIYSSDNRLEYTAYWQEKRADLEKLISSHSPTAVVNEISELKVVEGIASDINEFLGYISNIKNISFSELKEEGYKSILDSIGCEDVSHLVSLLLISFIPEVEKKEIMIDEWFDKYKATTDSYSIRASVAKIKGDLYKAEVNYKKALELNPDNAFVLNNYGYMLMELEKEHSKAREMLTKAIKIMPHLTEARLNLGCLLTDKFNEIEEAKEQYEEVISYNPTEERAYNNLANIYKRQSPKNKKTENIICELYARAIELDPNYIAARLGYGNYLSEYVGDFKKAEAEFSAILSIDPNSKELVGALFGRIETLKESKLKKKIKRNDPCPCGSGKKYKNCHGK